MQSLRPLNRCGTSSGTHGQMKQQDRPFTVAERPVAQPLKTHAATKTCEAVQRLRWLSVAVSAGGKDGIQEVRGSIPLSSTENPVADRDGVLSFLGCPSCLWTGCGPCDRRD